MKELTQQELDSKIANFLEERFSKHPELAQVTNLHASKLGRESVVSRVKNITRKFDTQTKSQPQYQL